LSPIRENQTPTSLSQTSSPSSSSSAPSITIAPIPEQTTISSPPLPPASSLFSISVSGVPSQQQLSTSVPSPKRIAPNVASSPTTVKAKLPAEPVEEKEEDFFSDLGLVPQYKEAKRVKVPVSSVTSQKKAPSVNQSAPPQTTATTSRYSMDTLMDSNEVVGEAWGDSDDLPLNLDTEESNDVTDSRKKKKPKPTGSKGKKKKGLLASSDSGSDGKKKNTLVSSVDDDMLPDLDNI